MLELVDDLGQLLGGQQGQMDLAVPRPYVALLGGLAWKAKVLQLLCPVPLPTADGDLSLPIRFTLRPREHEPTATVAVLSFAWRGRADGVRAAVERARAAVAAADSDISSRVGSPAEGVGSHMVRVTIEGRGLPHLTVVDLPSMQMENVVKSSAVQQDTRNLLMEHLRPREALILCVCAEESIAPALPRETLDTARAADPEGERTMAVVCRHAPADLDEVPAAGFFARFMRRRAAEPELQAAVWRLRSEGDQGPLNFLPASQLPWQVCDLMRDHVRKALPLIGNALRAELQRTGARLQQLSVCVSPLESMNEMQRAVDGLKQVFWRVVHGDYQALDELGLPGEQPPLAEAGRLCPRVDGILADYEARLRKEAPQVFSGDCAQEAAEAVGNTAGRSLPNFLCDEAFRALMRRWHAPYVAATRDTFKQLTRAALDVLQRLARASLRDGHAGLREFLLHRVLQAMKSQIDEAGRDVERLLAVEQRVVYTINPSYQATLEALRQCVDDPSEERVARAAGLIAEGAEGDAPAREFVQQLAAALGKEAPPRKVAELQLAAFCYNRVVRKRLSDALMQIAHYHYVEYIGGQLGFRLADGVTAEQAHDVLRPGLQEEQERARLTAQQRACQACVERIARAGLSHTVPDEALPRWALPMPAAPQAAELPRAPDAAGPALVATAAPPEPPKVPPARL
eukprot:TRINITY_DN55742_c0_g1_i1.p1 TRINITY_DN55742_c0_g1~~TRINITY_DN55742_c0_g1_i1.p1  ORF type:complete len:724 (+),score=240.28 TRINITY_DN55742_c0_g1_i1:112-2172(+)